VLFFDDAKLYLGKENVNAIKQVILNRCNDSMPKKGG
jgi:hypothetical protein